MTRQTTDLSLYNLGALGHAGVKCGRCAVKVSAGEARRFETVFPGLLPILETAG
jgi:hypothetical protein